MSKTAQNECKAEQSKDNTQDCVVFMTAYNIDKYRKKLLSFRKKESVKELLSQYHISCFATRDTMLTQHGRLEYTAQYDPHKQSTQFQFFPCKKDDSLANYEDDINQMSWLITLTHSIDLLIDKATYKFSFFINLERFLVCVNSRLLQVDPTAFFLNNMIFVNYELIDYITGAPLGKDEIYGRKNNYNIIPVDKMQYFGQEGFLAETRKIPDIIFDNITGFIERIGRKKIRMTGFSYVHNLFVISDSISDVDTYFLNVLNVIGLDLKLENINTNSAFEYYSKEYLGVVMPTSDESTQQALSDCILLETIKMYFLLNCIVGLENTNKLTETIDYQMSIDHLSFASGKPIITLNALENAKQTETYKRCKDAITFKVSYLSLLQGRKKNRNAMLLNVLLYILAFMQGISALQVIEDELGWPFKLCASLLTVVLFGLGILWVWQERKNEL